MKYLLEEQLFFNLDGICKRTGYKNPVWKFSGKMQSCTRCHQKYPDIHKAFNVLMMYLYSHYGIYWKDLGDSLKQFVNHKNNSLRKAGEVTNLKIDIPHIKYKMKYKRIR